MTKAIQPGWSAIYRTPDRGEFDRRLSASQREGARLRRLEPLRCNRCRGLMPAGDRALFCPTCIALT